MKRVLSYVFIVITGLLLFSCVKEEITPELSVSSAALSISGDGTVQTVTVTTNQPSWSYSTDQDWVTVSKHGNVLSISATPNQNISSRTGNITINAGPENLITASITVTQGGASPATLSLSSNSFSLTSESASVSVTILTNQSSWSYTVDQDWLTFYKQGSVLTISASGNTYPYSRNALVTVIAGIGENSANATVTFTQQGVTQASVSASKNVIELSNQGAATTVTISTNQSSWSFSVDQEWITVTRDGNKLTVKATPNGSSEIRNGTITITSGSIHNQASLIINVTQDKDAGGAGAGSGEFKELFD
ncbi:MAG: BACON domain-containing carbohydrate-binding protein [Bacteroidales bacterium]|nr:hypothetical protein [Bacteroidales bacterium]MDD2425708.1 BACON domain-containing carbohydrate-binding protein [Bacteroidales bacterium]MDD3989545.1 BACON domain-containing carbohydrate-binding protein [Bacteroidales bacterium]MDD4638313.1 BACON domain-containing carbohydrate-binding protein [Bacteroidales bacterium]